MTTGGSKPAVHIEAGLMSHWSSLQLAAIRSPQMKDLWFVAVAVVILTKGIFILATGISLWFKFILISRGSL